MKRLELVFCGLLALGGLGHLAGTLTGYAPGTEVFVWSLSASCFVFLIVFLHVLRILCGTDRLVTIASAVATIAWIGLALAFGAAVGNVADARVIMHVGVSLALLFATFANLFQTSPIIKPREVSTHPQPTGVLGQKIDEMSSSPRVNRLGVNP